MGVEPETGADSASRGVRDYIEAMLEQLAELARSSGELKLATIIRVAALEVSRSDPTR